MFDIGWSELLVIVIVAVVVVGPKDLPRLMRTVGQWAGRARAMADQFRRSFDDMARQSELDDLRREVQRLKTTPMTDADYKALGFSDEDLPPPPQLNPTIEDVGAAPPKIDTPDTPPEPAPESGAPSAQPAPSTQT